MLLDPWHGSNLRYKIAVISGMSLFAIGVILAITSATTGNSTLGTVALYVIGAGIAAHSYSLFERVKAAQRRRKEYMESLNKKR